MQKLQIPFLTNKQISGVGHKSSSKNDNLFQNQDRDNKTLREGKKNKGRLGKKCTRATSIFTIVSLVCTYLNNDLKQEYIGRNEKTLYVTSQYFESFKLSLV